MKGLSGLFVYVGIASMMIGWIWAIISGFQSGGVGWGIANIVPLQPLIGTVSALCKKVNDKPVLMMMGGVAAYYIGGLIGR